MIGRGGMGTVYCARRLSDNADVALKLLDRVPADSVDHLARFERESKTIQKLSHPNIVPCEDVGMWNGTPFLVMKLIAGVTLSQVMAWLKIEIGSGAESNLANLSDKTGADEKSVTALCLRSMLKGRSYEIALAEQIADVANALHAAHQSHIIHRDIKPSNLMLDESGKVWLTDFGLASAGDQLTQLTFTGDLLGTPAYMSPEQATGNSQGVDQRSDVYCLGATLFAMATFERPFSGTTQQILKSVSEGRFPRPSDIRPVIPRDLEAIILKAMSYQPSARYSTCAEMEADLRAFVAGRPIQARMPGLTTRSMHWMALHPKTTLLVATMSSVALIAIFIGQLLFSAQLSEINNDLKDTNARLDDRNQQLRVVNDELNDSNRRIQRLLYVSNTAAAYDAFARGEIDTARRLLLRSEDDAEQQKMRGSEWYVLKQLTQPAVVLSFQAHEGSATEIEVVPGRQEFVTAGTDGIVRRWALPSSAESLIEPRLVAEFQAAGPVNALAVSPDGKMLVVGQVGPLEVNLATLHDLETGEVIRPLCYQTTTIESAAFSAEGDKIALGARYRQVNVLDLEGKLLKTLPAGARNESVAFGSEGQCVTALDEAADETKGLSLFSLADGQQNVLAATHRPPVTHAIAASRSHIALVASHEETLLVDFSTHSFLTRTTDIRGRIRAVAVNDDASRFAAVCDNGLLHLWTDWDEEPAKRRADTSIGVPVVIDTGESGLTDVLLVDHHKGSESQEPTLVIATAANGQVKLCLAKNNDACVKDTREFRNLISAEESPDVVIGWTKSHELLRFDGPLNSDTKPVSLGRFRHTIYDPLAVSPMGDRITLSTPKGLLLLNSETGAVIRRPETPATRGAPQDILYLNADRFLVLYRDRLVQYSAETGEKLAEVVSPLATMNRFVKSDATGHLILTAVDAVAEYNAKTRQFRHIFEVEPGKGELSATAVSSDGKLAAIGKRDGTIQLVDVDSKKRLQVLRGHRHGVNSLFFSSNDQTLVSASADQAVRFWDVASGQPLGELPNTGAWLTLAPSQDALIAWGMDTPMYVWSVTGAGHSADY